MHKPSLVNTSRDGDQFHYLWAARRLLLLLPGRGDLVAVSIEGSSARELASGSRDLPGEEKIDVGEYFGEENLQKARLVRYTQLKHSTLHSSEHWTASGMQETISKFAERYIALSEELTKEVVQKRFQFRFVSNRPIGIDFQEAVTDAANGSPSRHPTELQKLERFTKLSGEELSAFLQLLKLEGNELPYWEQRNLLVQEIQGHLPAGDMDAPLALKEIVTRKALSEGSADPVIRRTDVLRALGADERTLYPAPCQIQQLEAALARHQERQLIEAIVNAQVPVVVHAPAGVGKTVFASRIGENLPAGSVTVLYDCFGDGQYRNASGLRHRHKDALVQIANEFAGKSLCFPLIPTSKADTSDYVRAFLHRLRNTVVLVQAADPGALVCVVVDAADNAQMVAEEYGEARCFVKDLIREQLPEGVRLVFLCRSHRQHLLDAPAASIAYELKSFDRSETAAHLRRHFPGASENDVEEFHRLTSENPRVQALALSRKFTLSETLRQLGPNPTSVDNTIGELLEGAISRLKDKGGAVERTQIDLICAGLAVLRPLVPISVLAKISGVEPAAIKSFAIDLGRPIRLIGESLQFFDEPSESWFREKFKPSPENFSRFVETLKSLSPSSAYISAAIPLLLLEAGRFDELVDIALKSNALPEESPLERRDVELQRLQFAVKAALRTRRYLDAAKLAFKAGGETAGEGRQRKLLQANTDLAAIFLGVESVQDIESRRAFEDTWLGSRHAYEAALFSGHAELLGDARSRLRMAEDWLRSWASLPNEERKKNAVKDEDIVELTLANLHIHGPGHAASELRLWTPRPVSYRVGRIVAERLIDSGRIDDALTLAREAANNVYLIVAIATELRRVQMFLPLEVTKRAFALLANRRVLLTIADRYGLDREAIDAVTSIAETAVNQRLAKAAEITALLSRYLPSRLPRGFVSRHERSHGALLRGYSLRAALQDSVISILDLAPEDVKAEIDAKKHSESSELREYKSNLGALLPWYDLRAKVLLEKIDKDGIDSAVTAAKASSEAAGTRSYEETAFASNEIATIWVDILRRAQALGELQLARFEQWKSSLKRPLFTPALNQISRVLGRQENTKLKALTLAQEAFALLEEERSDAAGKADGYIEIARSILHVSRSDAEHYFDEAVRVASKFGDEVLGRWDAVLSLGQRAEHMTRYCSRAAYLVARSAELVYDYVDRDKHFAWNKTIRVICGLSPNSAFPILSRWRDRDFGSQDRLLPIAVGQLEKRGHLHVLDGAALLGFNVSWKFDKLLQRCMEVVASDSEKELIANIVVKYAQHSGAKLLDLRDVLDKAGVRLEALSRAENEESEPDSGSREGGSIELHVSDLETNTQPSIDWDCIFLGCALSEIEGIARAYGRFRSGESPWDHEEFISKAMERVAVGDEVGFVESFADWPAVDLYQLKYFIEAIPSNWSTRPPIRVALGKAITKVVKRCWMDYRRYWQYEPFPFQKVSAITGLSEANLAAAVLDAIGASSEQIESDRLFSIVSLVSTSIDEDEALDALLYAISSFEAAARDADGDGPWSSMLEPPEKITESVAGYVWAALGAPSGTIRWEGAHCVLCLAAFGRQQVLSDLARFENGSGAGPFVDSRLPFYALHALQWLLIGLRRAAAEYPAAIAVFESALLRRASADETHVLIRELASKALLSLIEGGRLTEDNTLKGRLERVNDSPFPIQDADTFERAHWKVPEGSEGDSEDRWYFGIDFGPYWLAPLGRVFGVSQKEVELRALKIIRGEFGDSSKGRWSDDPRAKRKIYEDRSTWHSHGSHPRVDDLQFYQSYHAMMKVAGALLKTMPTYRERGSESPNEFSEWLEGYGLSRRDSRWLWDRRDSTPRFRHSWRDRKFGAGEVDELLDGDFDEIAIDDGRLTLWGQWTEADSEREQSVYVASALVSTSTADSLLRALATTSDPYDYRIPSFNDELEIDETDFTLKGWIEDRTCGSRLDEQDRWSGDIKYPPPAPAQIFANSLQLVPSIDLRYWRDPHGAIAIETEVWGQFDENLRHGRADPERGSRLLGTGNLVLSLIKLHGASLIVKVAIERRRRERAYTRSNEDDEQKTRKRARLYVYSADGTVRTI